MAIVVLQRPDRRRTATVTITATTRHGLLAAGDDDVGGVLGVGVSISSRVGDLGVVRARAPAGSAGRARCGWPAAGGTASRAPARRRPACSASSGRATATQHQVVGRGDRHRLAAAGPAARGAGGRPRRSGSKSVRPTRCIWYISDSAATRTSSVIAPWATRMSPSGSPVREYSSIARLELVVGDQPAAGEHPGHLHPRAARLGGLDLRVAWAGRPRRSPAMISLTRVAHQQDRAVDAARRRRAR